MTNWIAVDDWLPAPNETVLIHFEYEVETRGDEPEVLKLNGIRAGYRDSDKDWYIASHPGVDYPLSEDYKVTHWTLLPEGPK